MPIGHNVNFVWNQDEVPQNSRETNKFFDMSWNSAQTVAALIWFLTLIY